jgi:hypothetical protein
MCTFNFNKSFLFDTIVPEPRFNFTKADWVSYGNSLNKMIDEMDISEDFGINELDALFTSVVSSAADGAIPKFTNKQLKSYPGPIVHLIKRRRVVRKKKRKKKGDELKSLNAEYNNLTHLIRNSIKKYTEEKWAEFLGKLGPYPPSSSIFWQIINRARTHKKSTAIPTLISDGFLYESDEEKASLFASVLGKTYTEAGADCSDFDSKFYRDVEEIVANLDYSDNGYDNVSFLVLVNIIHN